MMKLLQTEKRLCSCCMEVHEVKQVRVWETAIIKNQEVKYEADYFYCDAAEEFFMDEVMMSQNDMHAKNALRRELGLLTSEEIVEIRLKYGISQGDLCVLLGWGGKTLTRYEGHQIQDKAHDSILKKLNQDPEWFLHLLDNAKQLLRLEAYNKYYHAALALYENDQDQYLRKSIEAKYARYRENPEYNGNASLCLDKVVDVIRYFSDSVHVVNLFKVKLMKLLWYADCLAYKDRGYAITGLVYQALPMGAVPIGHESIIDLKGIICEEIDMGDGTAYRFCASGIAEYGSLQQEERNILDRIIMKFGKMSKDEIVAYMHREQAYIETKPRDIISFKYAKCLQII